MIRIFNKIIKSEKGFTLIEIIAAFIIMGILAAVAVPKFFSIQEEAKIAALNGALSEAATRFNDALGKYIVVTKKAPSEVAGVLDNTNYLGPKAVNEIAGGEDIGDFNVVWLKTGADELTIRVISSETIGQTTLDAMPAAIKQKVVTGVNWGS